MSDLSKAPHPSKTADLLVGSHICCRKNDNHKWYPGVKVYPVVIK